MSYSKVIEINFNGITIDIGNGTHRIITEVATKLVNIRTNEIFFFKSIKDHFSSGCHSKFINMVLDNYLYVDNYSYYYKVKSIQRFEIEVEYQDGRIVKISTYDDAQTMEMVNIKTNQSFFYESVKLEKDNNVKPQIYEMVEAHQLYIKGQPSVKPTIDSLRFYGGKRSRKQHYIKKLL